MVQPQLNLGIFDKLLEENQPHLSAVNLLLLCLLADLQGLLPNMLMKLLDHLSVENVI